MFWTTGERYQGAWSDNKKSGMGTQPTVSAMLLPFHHASLNGGGD